MHRKPMLLVFYPYTSLSSLPESAVAQRRTQLLSAVLEIKGLWVRALPAALRCVLDQVTFIPLSSGSAQEEPSQHS